MAKKIEETTRDIWVIFLDVNGKKVRSVKCGTHTGTAREYAEYCISKKSVLWCRREAKRHLLKVKEPYLNLKFKYLSPTPGTFNTGFSVKTYDMTKG